MGRSSHARLAVAVLLCALAAAVLPCARAAMGDVSVACTDCTADLTAAWNVDNEFMLFTAETSTDPARGAVLYKTSTDTSEADRTAEVRMGTTAMDHVRGLAPLSRKRVVFGAEVDAQRTVVVTDGESETGHTYWLHEGNMENWTGVSGNLGDVFVWHAQNNDGLSVVFATDGTRERTAKVFDLRRTDVVLQVFRFRARVFIAVDRAEHDAVGDGLVRDAGDARSVVLLETDGTRERSRVFMTLPEGSQFVAPLVRDREDDAVFFFVRSNATGRTEVWTTHGSVADTAKLPLELHTGAWAYFTPRGRDPVLLYVDTAAATLTLRHTTGSDDTLVVAFPPHVARVQFLAQNEERVFWVAHAADAATHAPQLYSYDGVSVLLVWEWPAARMCTVDADGSGRTVQGYADWLFFVCAESPLVVHRASGHANREPVVFVDLADVGLGSGSIHSLAWAGRHIYVSYTHAADAAENKVLAVDSGVDKPPAAYGAAPSLRAPLLAAAVAVLVCALLLQ